MNPHRTRALGSAAALAVGCAAALAAAEAGALHAYEEGLRELRFGRWAPAAARLREALARDPVDTEAPIARPYGMVFAPYLPHHYLGLALCQAGDWPAAAESWAESDRRGAVAQSAAARELGEERRRCAAGLASTARAAIDADWRAFEESLGALDERTGAGRSAELGELQARRSALAESDDLVALAAFRETLAAAVRRSVGLAAAAAGANPAGAAASAAAKSRIASLESRLRDLDRAANTGLPVERSLRAEIAAAAVGLAAVERDLGALPTERAASVAASWEERHDELARRLEAARLPRALWDAARSLFAGSPRAALAALEGFASDRPRALAQAHLLRAAALDAELALLPGGDPGLGARRDAEIRACRRADAGLEPLAGYFSPDFRARFASVAGSDAPR